MNGISRKLLSLFLALTLVLQLIPVQALGLEPIDLTESDDIIEEATDSPSSSAANDAEIVAEIPEGRGEFQKEFVLSNGMRMISIYGAAVHYEENGEWKEIDNTLQPISSTGTVLTDKTALASVSAYKNTAGIWDVKLPASLNANNAVEVSRDGYTLSFQFAGEINNNHVIMSAGDENETKSIQTPVAAPTQSETGVGEIPATPAEPSLSPEVSSEVLDTTAAEEALAALVETPSELAATAEPDTIETSAGGSETPTEEPVVMTPENSSETESLETVTDKSAVATFTTQVNAASAAVLNLTSTEAEFPSQAYTDKLYSAVTYNNIYANTDLRYDLQSHQLKESVIIKQAKDTLAGYKYVLSAPGMTLELQDDNVILAYAANAEDGDEPLFYMPAPFLMDDSGTYNDDITVSLQQNGETYTLTYSLPRTWLLEEDRAYPVVLDPVVRPQSSMYTINDQTVFSNATKSHTWACLACGYSPSLGIGRALIKFNNLPTLTSADVIVSASLGIKKYTTSSTANIMEAHQVYKTWESWSVTWADMATAGSKTWNSKVEDYNKIQNAGWYYWDITNIAQQWYASGKNTGVLFKLSSGSENSSSLTLREFYASDWGGSVIPTLQITYLNNCGLEDYWDYTSQSVGRAGTGHVNNFTGNLVWVHNGLSFAGSRMPVSISHIYNANDKSSNDCGMGYGWRTNYNQRVYQWTEDTSYYVWIDQDGTRRYFEYSSSGTYKNEIDNTLVLTTTGSGDEKYCITDKDGNKSYFDTKGRLKKICNNQETPSIITITYTSDSSRFISTITDGSGVTNKANRTATGGRVYAFNYNTDDLLTSIVFKGTGSEAISTLTYTYDDSSNLTTITYPDGESVYYCYNRTHENVSLSECVAKPCEGEGSENHLLHRAFDVDGYRVEYAYTDTAPHRVTHIAEFDDSKDGGTLSIEYAHNQTSFTDHNNRKEIVQFNNFGSTISIQDDQGRAQFAKYTSGDSAKSASQLTLSSKLQNTVVDLLRNGGFETTSYWTIVSDSTTGSAGYTSAQTYLGAKSLQLTCNEEDSGRYAYSSTDSVCTAKPGKPYTLSAYVKTTSMNGSGNGAKIALKLSGSGNIVATSEAIKVTSDWTRLEVTYTHPADAAEDLLVAMLFNDSTGTAYFDCVQLEQSATASRYNLIENGDFSRQKTTSTDSYGWLEGSDCTDSDKRVLYTGSSSNPNIAVTAAPQMDNYVYAMSGASTLQKRSYQDLQISGSKGDVYTLAGWAKGDCVPLRSGSGRRFGLILRFCTDAGTQKETLLNFNPDTDSALSWQYLAGRVVAPINYDYIRVLVVYEYNRNTVYFDGIQLFKEEFGQSYEYDKDTGDLDSVTDLQGQTTSYDYYDNGNLKTISLGTGDDKKVLYSYEYDQYSNVSRSENAEGIVTEFDYDTYGNNTCVTVTDGTKTLTTTAQYTGYNHTTPQPLDGNQLVSMTDALGYTTTYNYNEQTGVLMSSQAPGNVPATTYSYDNLYRNTRAAQANTEVLYEYTGDLLSKITSASKTEYNFDYGDFNLLTGIRIGTESLVEHTYSTDGNFYLTKSTYGNEDHISYTYDSLGRTESKTYEDGDKIEYEYDNSGNLAQTADSATGRTTKYFYDLQDRLMRYDETGSGYSNSVSWSYDARNNLIGQVQTLNGTSYTASYGYNEYDDLISSTQGSTTSAYTYDGFGRMSTIIGKHNAADIVTSNITYKNVGSTGTSSQINTWSNVTPAGTTTYTYVYDSHGNIISITDSNNNTTTYAYDTHDQLIRENNEAANHTWVYSYDDGGNILTKTEYAYSTTDTLQQQGESLEFTYSTGAWKDQIAELQDGFEPCYDGIGNLTDDGTRRYSWEHGRQLASLETQDHQVSFSYNADGLRTSKTVDGTTTQYYYNGDTLVGLTCGNHTLHFVYDILGPAAVDYNGTRYYYTRNAQGDVTGIISTSGAKMAEYAYDAWGNPISIPNAATSTLGELNPFRYRSYIYDSESGLYYLLSRYYNPAWGRFINADAVLLTDNLLGNNQYAYCCNNPVTYDDPTGHGLDFIFDLASLAFSIKDVIDDPSDPWAWASLGLDALCLAVPFLSGGGALVRGATKVDDAVDVVRGVDKATDLARTADTAVDFAQGINHAGDVAQTSKSVSRATKGGETAATKRGREMHKLWDYGPGVEKEVKIGPGCRVDGIDEVNHIIYELKPNNPRAIQRGLKQLDRYLSIMGAEDWAGVLVLYE